MLTAAGEGMPILKDKKQIACPCIEQNLPTSMEYAFTTAKTEIKRWGRAVLQGAYLILPFFPYYLCRRSHIRGRMFR